MSYLVSIFVKVSFKYDSSLDTFIHSFMPRRVRASEDRQVVLLRRLDAAQAEWRATRRRHRVLARNQCVLLAAVG